MWTCGMKYSCEELNRANVDLVFIIVFISIMSSLLTASVDFSSLVLQLMYFVKIELF